MRHHPLTSPAALALLCLGLMTSQAQADSGLSVNASVGRLDYNITTTANQEWEGDGRAITLGGSYAFGAGEYVSLSYTGVGSGEVQFSYAGAPGGPRRTLKRSDVALTVGKGLANKLNVFVGAKTARSDIENAINTQFQTSGFFVGLSYPLLAGRHNLAVSGALGFNRGSWKDSTGSLSDTALGYSAGLRYGIAVDRWMFGVGAKAQRYVYDFTNQGYAEVKESIRLLEFTVDCSF